MRAREPFKVALAAAFVVSFAAGASAQSTSSSKINQDAIAALEKMGAYLRTLRAFQVNAATTKDEVLQDGQKVQFGGTVNLLAVRPDRLRLEVVADRQQRTYFYDGKSFTLWAQRVNYYATVAAPPTIGELADRLKATYKIEMPLVDLFYWGTDRSKASSIQAAVDVGPSAIQGVSCEHYAFRQPGLDWQVWVQLGDYPLPRQLVLTTTDDEARPQYSSVMSWNLAPSFNEAAFTFVPPAGAKKIVFQEFKAPTGAKR